jgi:hypothetical protein
LSALVEGGRIRQLDRRAEPPDHITEEQVTDPPRLARMLMTLFRDLASLQRRWHPDSITHRDRLVDGSGTVVHDFPHGFAGRVHWSVVDWTGASGAPALVRHASSDDNTLRLVSYEAGIVTLRIEQGG